MPGPEKSAQQVGEFAARAWRLTFNPQHSCNKPGMAIYLCNAHAVGLERALVASLALISVRDPISRVQHRDSWIRANDAFLWPSSVHGHIFLHNTIHIQTEKAFFFLLLDVVCTVRWLLPFVYSGCTPQRVAPWSVKCPGFWSRLNSTCFSLKCFIIPSRAGCISQGMKFSSR